MFNICPGRFMTGKGYVAVNIPQWLCDEVDKVRKDSRDKFIQRAIKTYIDFLHRHNTD